MFTPSQRIYSNTERGHRLCRDELPEGAELETWLSPAPQTAELRLRKDAGRFGTETVSAQPCGSELGEAPGIPKLWAVG